MIDQNNAEKIYYNGMVLTMETDFPEIEAVAVAKDTIIGTGTFEAMKQLADENTCMIDLQGKTLLPGFIDAHSHFLDTVPRTLWVDVNSIPLGLVESIKNIITLLKEQAAITPPGDWVVGWGYDDSRIKEMRHPDKDDLDKVSTAHPVAISHISGWVTSANSMALKQSNLTDTTKDTDYYRLQRDKSNKITGVIETALCPIMAKIPLPSEEAFLQGIKTVSDMYLAKGCTTSQEGWVTAPEYIEHCQTAIQRNLLKTRLVLYPVGEGDVYDKYGDAFPDIPSGQYLDDKKMLVMGAMKLTCDGSIQAYTACLSKPYHVCPEGKEGHCGTPNHDQQWLNERVLKFHKAAQQVACHCNGDQAVEMFINACEAAQQAFPRDDPRFIFIHCQTARTDQLERIAALKGCISFFSVHSYYWGERHYAKFLGPERTLRLNPIREANELGINTTAHNDTYVTPIDPLLSVWSVVNRQSYEGNDMGKALQGISVEEALKAVTIHAAYQGFEEKHKGSIAVGKLADFVVLEENPLKADPLHIKDIRVLATIVGGETVYGTLSGD